MLSKFYDLLCPKDNGVDKDFFADLQMVALSDSHLENVRSIHPGGTLGLFFEGTKDGHKYFVKTHKPNEEARKNLIKELFIIQGIYGNDIELWSFCANIKGHEQVFLCMPFFEISKNEYSIKDIDNLASTYALILNDKQKYKMINYSEKDFINAVNVSNDMLFRKRLISKDIYHYIEKAFRNYESYTSDGLCVCHGDLSNPNIVDVEGRLVALDWEDAMFGVPKYDLLYWLTFFSQRRYYNSMMFRDIGISEGYAKDIMAMILSVKSYLSVLNDSYHNNRLTIEDRIAEIIYL